MNTVNANAAPLGFMITKGDGKGITTPDGHRMVKASEKKIGKGKGKTIAFCLLPTMAVPNEDEVKILLPMIGDLCEELQKDIVTRMAREGMAAVTPSEVDYKACVLEYANRTFSADNVGSWFDNEVQELLAFQIITAKGWNTEELNADQVKMLETKCAAYKASYVECAAKFPSLNPDQCKELVRVIDLLDLTGPIVSRIRDKIVPKETSTSLGFD